MKPRRPSLTKGLSICIASSVLVGPAFASPAISAAAGSGPTIDLRVRHETVDDAAFERDARADTLRVRLGYRWVFASHWQLHVQGEHTEALFGQHYNSTANGRTQYPVIADPEADEINEAWLGYRNAGFDATLGRQRVLLDNQRFFGNVGWRQNEQTFDALAAAYRLGEQGPTLRYHYLDRVLRVFGQQNPNPLLRDYTLDGHLFNISHALPIGAVVVYAYYVENADVATLSTRTLGARWTGSQSWGGTRFAWTAEWADQSDYGNNPQAQNAQYRFVEPSISLGGITVKAGWEVLGGDGSHGFSTPYATLHAFNGWADRFPNTPVNGLDDRYVGVGGRIGKAAWSASYHDFRADHGQQDYGREFDASIDYPFNSHVSGLLKLADYRGDGFVADVRKLWASLEYRY
jgi:hypothetical protein